MHPPNSGGSTSSPNWPGWLKGYAKDISGRAETLYTDPAHATPPPLDPATVRALGAREAMAGRGSPVAGAAAGEAARTLRGDYLNPASNPYLTAVADRAVSEGLSDVTSRFTGAGRAGSGAASRALADAAMGTRAAIYSNAYENERGRMGGALAAAPAAYGLEYADTGMLEDVGRAREVESQRQFDWPYELLDRYAGTVYGNPMYGAPGSTTRNNLSWLQIVGALGGALQPSLGGGSP